MPQVTASNALAAASLVPGPQQPFVAAAAVLAKLLGGSGAAKHGPGSAGRAQHESAAARKYAGESLAENVARLDRYLKSNNNCRAATDPASCQKLASILIAEIKRKQLGGPIAAPMSFAAPAVMYSAQGAPVDDLATLQRLLRR